MTIYIPEWVLAIVFIIAFSSVILVGRLFKQVYRLKRLIQKIETFEGDERKKESKMGDSSGW